MSDKKGNENGKSVNHVMWWVLWSTFEYNTWIRRQIRQCLEIWDKKRKEFFEILWFAFENGNELSSKNTIHHKTHHQHIFVVSFLNKLYNFDTQKYWKFLKAT